MNRALIRLSHAIKNTDISNLSKTQLEHFEQIKADYAKVLNSPNAKNFNNQDLENILNNCFEIEKINWPYQIKPGEIYPVDYNIRLKPVSNVNIPPLLTQELPNFKDIPGSNPYTHHKIPHYKSIIGFIIENGKTHVLVTNWTTTNNSVQNVIQGTLLDGEIDSQHLDNLLKSKDLHLSNYSKLYPKNILKQYIKDKVPVYREKATWAAGEYGNKYLIPVDTITINGQVKTQYATLVVQKYALKDLNIHFTIDKNNIPPWNFKQTLLNYYKNEKTLSIFNPLSGTYKEIDINQINFVDPQKLTRDLVDLQNLSKIEDTVFWANIEGKTLEDYYKEKGLLIDINPETQEIIKENTEDKTEFNTLPSIEGPKGPDL